MNQQSPNEHDRIRAIEEEIGLTELRTGQLDEMVRELSGQVFDLAKRLESLERRFVEMTMPVEDTPDTPPPHSHRPL
ncbi:MAG TPA: hypothetical protein ENK11_00820 [Phycisphaerales bacterium]|nr:hypothetical protein [Phycisphaerales bacterium]